MKSISLESLNKNTESINKNKEEKKTNKVNNVSKENLLSRMISNPNINNIKKLNEKNKREKNKNIIIKKLENENARLRKLLITYKLKKNNYQKSTEKIKKFYNYFFDKKLSLINSNNNYNNCNLSNILTHNNDNSIVGNQNYLTNAKNSLSNHILENIIDKMLLIPNKNKSKSKKKNSGSCSILLTEGNYAKNLKRSNYKEMRSNSKKNKLINKEIKSNKINSKIRKINKNKTNSINGRINLIKNNKEIFDINRNKNMSNLSNCTVNTNYEKNKNNTSDKYNYKRNKNIGIKTSYHSLKIEGNNSNLFSNQSEKNNNTNYHHNKTKTLLSNGNKKIIQKNIKSFNKILLANIINHNSFNMENFKKVEWRFLLVYKNLGLIKNGVVIIIV